MVLSIYCEWFQTLGSYLWNLLAMLDNLLNLLVKSYIVKRGMKMIVFHHHLLCLICRLLFLLMVGHNQAASGIGHIRGQTFKWASSNLTSDSNDKTFWVKVRQKGIFWHQTHQQLCIHFIFHLHEVPLLEFWVFLQYFLMIKKWFWCCHS